MNTPKPFLSLPEFAAVLPKKGRLIGLDVGETTIGVAVSDESRLSVKADQDSELLLFDLK